MKCGRTLINLSIVFAFVLFSISAHGQSLSQKIIANFSIDDQNFSIIREGEDSSLENTYVVKLNNKSVTVIKTWRVGVEGYFDLVDLHKVVILSTTPSGMGNACPKNLILVSFNDNGVVTVSKEFGNCHEAPAYIISGGDSIRINFPYGKNPIAESWVYNKYGLRQIKESPPKKKAR